MHQIGRTHLIGYLVEDGIPSSVQAKHTFSRTSIMLRLCSHASMYQIHVVFRFNPRSRCNRSSRCCYRAREHVDPARSRRIRHGGDSHPEISSSPGSVGLARAHPLTKTQAMEPSRQTCSSYGPPYPLGRGSSERESCKNRKKYILYL